MDFFYDQFNKIKNNLIIILAVIVLIIINNVFIFMCFNKNSTKIKNEESNESLLSTYDDKVASNVQNNLFKVDIKGEVKHPGVYEVDETMNVYDVITKAGGLTKKASTNSINLSKLLKSEMVIIVPSKTKTKSIVNNSNNMINNANNVLNNDALISAEPQNNEDIIGEINVINNIEENNNLVNINTAKVEDLMQISGIGESKAKAIVDYREKTPFESIDDIKNVSGIGDSLFEKIKDFITV